MTKRQKFAKGVCILVSACAVTGCGMHSHNPESALQELSHLATLECEYTIVSAMEHPDLVFGDVSCLSRYVGRAAIAFDLANATTDLQGNTLRITLPNAELLSPKIDSAWETIHEHRSGLVSRKTFNQYRDEAEREAQAKLEEKTRDKDLQRMAADQAIFLVQNFYAINFPQLEVIVKKGEQ